MARFKFSKRILEDKPNSSDINQINSDFEDFFNDKLNNENIKDESIRFRHLLKPASMMLYKDCSEDLFTYGCYPTSAEGTGLNQIGRTGVTFDMIKTANTEADNTAKIYFKHDGVMPSQDGKLFEVTMMYHPYSASARSRVAPAFQDKLSGNWVVMSDFEKYIGIKAGRSGEFDCQPYGPVHPYPYHPCLGWLPTASKRKTGNPRTDMLASVAFGAGVTINFQVGPEGISHGDGLLHPLQNIQAFGLAINHDRDNDIGIPGIPAQIYFKSQCTRYDKLIFFIIARDY
tara:strand:- start:1926 stop:2786 length:861 start_codon:yes stop_codon:yes gene_type:complete